MELSIKNQTRFTAEALTAAALVNSKKNNSIFGKHRILIVLLFLAILAILPIVLRLISGESFSILLLKDALPLGILAIVYIVIIKVVSNKKAMYTKAYKRVAKNEATPVYQYEFTENGFTIAAPFITGKYDWQAVTSATFDGNYYFLKVNAFQHIIVEKNGFASAIDAQQFEKLLMQKHLLGLHEFVRK